VREALALREHLERAHAEVLAAVDEAEASVTRREGRIITQQSMRDLAAEMKQRGRRRLAAEQNSAR
jgi:hypothetical protein